MSSLGFYLLCTLDHNKWSEDNEKTHKRFFSNQFEEKSRKPQKQLQLIHFISIIYRILSKRKENKFHFCVFFNFFRKPIGYSTSYCILCCEMVYQKAKTLKKNSCGANENKNDRRYFPKVISWIEINSKFAIIRTTISTKVKVNIYRIQLFLK